jgi:hypothetical protein
LRFILLTNERVRRASLSHYFGFLYFCSTPTIDTGPEKIEYSQV